MNALISLTVPDAYTAKVWRNVFIVAAIFALEVIAICVISNWYSSAESMAREGYADCVKDATRDGDPEKLTKCKITYQQFKDAGV